VARHRIRKVVSVGDNGVVIEDPQGGYDEPIPTPPSSTALVPYGASSAPTSWSSGSRPFPWMALGIGILVLGAVGYAAYSLLAD
jgi:hypothetical protein